MNYLKKFFKKDIEELKGAEVFITGECPLEEKILDGLFKPLGITGVSLPVGDNTYVLSDSVEGAIRFKDFFHLDVIEACKGFFFKDEVKVSHPLQPLKWDPHACLRFKENKILSYLLDEGKIDLNEIAALPFPREDRIQLAQLIGYSVDGFLGLSYVDFDTYGTLIEMEKNPELDERDAKIKHYEEVLGEVRKNTKALVADLFPIHPDDLDGEY